jgi:uncharacterized membrane protein YhhN
MDTVICGSVNHKRAEAWMIDTILLTAAIILLVALLYFEKRDSRRGRLLTKPFLSALFVAVALTGPKPDPVFVYPVLAGLLFCMAGDVFLIFSDSKNLFLAGLVSFLIGHILYAGAFFAASQPRVLIWIVGACCVTVSGVIFAWLRPHLGKMLRPVLAYIVVITAMVIGAVSLLENESRNFSGRVLVFSGAVLFYASDICVARQQFVLSQYVNRLVGLPLYYLAQFMIALSIRFL